MNRTCHHYIEGYNDASRVPLQDLRHFVKYIFISRKMELATLIETIQSQFQVSLLLLVFFRQNQFLRLLSFPV